eukprot:TRINITY_DN68819_c0_g1_i1.p1 TRINITY_DN68819_c0_g1~~TRINITY_DN68819_c0_g1_i1.p1  ORF type:complete len:553 (+),score=65.93 TRINITY_DN68819_c0_g1_i1:71-1729(+)
MAIRTSSPPTNRRCGASVAGMKVPVCDFGYGPLSCLMSVSQPLGLSACKNSESAFLPCSRMRECLGSGECNVTQDMGGGAGANSEIDPPVDSNGVFASTGKLERRKRAHFGDEVASKSSAEIAAGTSADDDVTEILRLSVSGEIDDRNMRDSIGVQPGLQRSQVGVSAASAAREQYAQLSEKPSSLVAPSTNKPKTRALFEPVATAVRSGRFVEAYRRLNRLKDSGVNLLDGMTESMIERIRRMGTRFDDSLRDICPSESDGWKTETDNNFGIEFSIRLTRGIVQVVSSRVFEGVDALIGFVALCELDLYEKYFPDIATAEPLRERMNDSIWRLKRNAHGGREDNVVHVSCLDSLDEPLGGLWLCLYTPETEGASELCKVPLPKPEAQAVRVGFWRSVFVITPIWAETTAGATAVDEPSEMQQSFRLTFALQHRTTAASCVFPEVLMRREVVCVYEGLRKFLQEDHDAIANRILTSHKATFYGSVRRHLFEVAPSTAIKPTSPFLLLNFGGISSFLPSDWADTLDEVPQSLWDEMREGDALIESFDSPLALL